MKEGGDNSNNLNILQKLMSKFGISSKVEGEDNLVEVSFIDFRPLILEKKY